MIESTATLNGARNVKLHTVDWLPEGEPVADLVLAHGYAEHCARYRHVAEHFCAAGVAVHALDHRGHGKSSGIPFGSVDDFGLLVDDLLSRIDQVRTDRPLFLYGHSMGGLAVVRALESGKAGKIAGAIIASALLAPAEGVPAPLIKVVNLLAKVAPNLKTIVLDDSTISHDPAVLADYNADPLNFRGKITAGTGAQMNIARVAAVAEAGRITEPVLFVHGTADNLTAPAGTVTVFGTVGSKDKRIELFPGAFHELHNEPEKADVLALYSDWVLERCGS